MNSFQDWEIKGRTWFGEFLTQYGATDITFTEDPFDPVDLYFTHKEKKIVAEIKCRDIKYLDYPDHIIESIKVQALLSAKEKENCHIAYYVNFFGENIVIIYTINSILEYSRKDNLWCNRTTSANTGKKDKEVYYIPKDLGWIYKKEDEVWARW